jgi:hypothetical protein
MIIIPKRIHVAPLGFEHDRIILPLIKYKADELYLVTMREEKHGKIHLKNVINTLKQKEIKYTIIEADLLDLIDSIQVFGKIVYELKIKQGHDVYVNISTSTSIATIAISYVAMLWGATAYHAQPKKWIEEDKRKPGEPITTGLNDVIGLQRLHHEKPDSQFLYILSYIDKQKTNDTIKYSNVLNHLWDKGWLDAPKNSKFPRQAVTRQFQERYIKNLEQKWEFISIRGNTQARKIELTEKGKKYLKMFSYLVQ